MARSKNTQKINRVTVSFDDRTHKVLLDYSQRDDVSISWLIRRAVAEMIGNLSLTANPNKPYPGTERKKA